MRRRTTHALLSLSCMAAAAVAFAGTPDKTPAKAAPAATAMQDVAGSAVVASLRSQFDGRDVEFKLTDVDAQRVSLRDMALQGEGRIRIDGTGGWLPVHFEALYDTATGTVLSPAITLDRNSATSPQAPTAGLDEAVAAALGEEFASQHVAFQLDSARHPGRRALDPRGLRARRGACTGRAGVRRSLTHDPCCGYRASPARARAYDRSAILRDPRPCHAAPPALMGPRCCRPTRRPSPCVHSPNACGRARSTTWSGSGASSRRVPHCDARSRAGMSTR